MEVRLLRVHRVVDGDEDRVKQLRKGNRADGKRPGDLVVILRREGFDGRRKLERRELFLLEDADGGLAFLLLLVRDDVLGGVQA